MTHAEPPALVEADLVEFTDRRGKPHLTGRVGDARVSVFLQREQFDAQAGKTHRIWRMVVERQP